LALLIAAVLLFRLSFPLFQAERIRKDLNEDAKKNADHITRLFERRMEERTAKLPETRVIKDSGQGWLAAIL